VPRLSCWFVRTSLIYLALGFTLGSLLLFHKGVALDATLWRLLPLHIELLMLGWTLQLAMGVAFWILPRFHGRRHNEKLAWLAFVSLNGGVLIVGLGTLLQAPSEVLFAGRMADGAAVIAFAAHTWARVKPLGA
jgi:cbb3-type cytochrome oxidase subunit 1